LSVPLSQTAPSLVVVCADGPLLTQVTIVPAFTVSAEGVNEKSWIFTQAPVHAGDVELLHAITAAKPAVITTRVNHMGSSPSTAVFLNAPSPLNCRSPKRRRRPAKRILILITPPLDPIPRYKVYTQADF